MSKVLLFVLFCFCFFFVLDKLSSVNFLDASYKQSYKVQGKHDTCQTREGLVATLRNAAASPGCHVVIWLSHVRLIHSCVSLYFHHLELTARIFYIRQFLYPRRCGKSFASVHIVVNVFIFYNFP